MGKKKVLYFMHCQWGWIKQRPHFFAEELSNYFDLKVVTKQCYERESVKNESFLRIRHLFRLPFERLPIIYLFNTLLYKIQLLILGYSSDYIWLMSPEQIYLLPRNLRKKDIIYDCMDDMLEFPMTDKKREWLQNAERELCENARYIFTSSDYLKNKLISRYKVKRIHVVNNAIKDIKENTHFPLPSRLLHLADSVFISLTYIGTISSWIDIELIQKILSSHKGVKLYLFGPIEIQLPDIERLEYCGVLTHDEVFSVMQASDILIMPFILNDLILSVNPVKLYEYIYSGKACIAPKYGESIKFEEYVYLYNNHEDCINIIGEILNNANKAKCMIKTCRDFASNNTWKHRIKTITETIDC